MAPNRNPTTTDPGDWGTPAVRRDQQPGEASTALGHVLDLTQAQYLQKTMMTLLESNALSLDAGDVERMSTPCAQVLLAAGKAAEAAGSQFRIRNPSAAFQAAIADLGLRPEFSNWMD